MLDTISALLLLLIIPGPTNTLLFRAGMMFGFSSSRRLAFIESIAYMIQVSLWGAALLYVSAYAPWAIKIIQVCAAGYLFYTSYKLWQNKNSTFGESKDQFSGQYFFLLTLMNPKGLLIVSFIAHDSTFTELGNYVKFMATLLFVTFTVGFSWIYLGARFKGPKQSQRTTLKINRVTALAIFCFASIIIGRLADSTFS
ncbi:LysE family translocator [Edaphovirga cremea]|uniref:LysE family translocator n=1 Tax=Edaphovirga cremea TaxID=2267246 RepID=UPI003989B696